MKFTKTLSTITSLALACGAYAQVGSTFTFVAADVSSNSFETKDNWVEGSVPQSGADILITKGASVYMTGMGYHGSKKSYSFGSITLDTGATTAFLGNLGGEFGGGWQGTNPRINARLDLAGDMVNVSGNNVFTTTGDSNPLSYIMAFGGKLDVQGGSLRLGGGSLSNARPYVDSISANALEIAAGATMSVYTSTLDIATTAEIAGATLNLFAINLSEATSLLDINSTMTIDTATKIVIDFERIGTLNAGTYDLITLSESANISDIQSLVEFKNTDKIEATFHWEGNRMYAVAVPETSTVAAVFGAIALLAVAIRRRK